MIKDVTILIPAYNEVKFIKKAIVSAVSQAEFVIVSDNNSDDGTGEICEELANKYSNLIFFEQSENIGGVKNFEFLLSKVTTEYILHIGAHDYIAENYVLVLKKLLENTPNAVASYAPYISVDDDGKILDENLLDDFENKLLSKTPSERILAIIEHREFIFTIFGLFQTKVFRKYFEPISTAGPDCLLLSQIAADGMFLRTPSTRFYRRVITRKDSAEAYMKRLTGNGHSIPYDLSYMCTKQFELLKNQSSLEEQEVLLKRASLSMQRLYGSTCYKSLDKTLDIISETDEKYILYGAGSEAYYIRDKLKEKILFIVDQDVNKQNTCKNGIDIKSLDVLEQYSNKIIISLLGRFELVSESLITEYNIDSSRLISPIDYSYKINL